jgi:hypothetical protein
MTEAVPAVANAGTRGRLGGGVAPAGEPIRGTAPNEVRQGQGESHCQNLGFKHCGDATDS